MEQGVTPGERPGLRALPHGRGSARGFGGLTGGVTGQRRVSKSDTGLGRASSDNQTCAAANGGGFPVCNLEELRPHRLVCRLPVEELVGEVGLSALAVAVQSGLEVGVERKAAETFGSFFGMLFGERGLIEVTAFEGNAEKHLAFAV